MPYYYSPPPPPSPSPSPSPPPPHSPTLPYYPYYSPPPPPPKHPKNCTIPPPSPPIIYNCTCICPTPPTSPPYHYPPPPPLTPNYAPSYNYTVEHDYKAVIAVSVSLGGILVAFLFLGAFFFAKKKKPEDVPPPPPPSPPPPPQPSYQYGAVPQTATSTYEAIEIIEEAGGDDAAGGQSYEPANPSPVPHDYGHQNYG